MRTIKFRIPITSFATGEFIKFMYVTLSHGVITSDEVILSNDYICGPEQQFVNTLKDMELYEGDRVLVKGTTRIGEYETEIIFKDFCFQLRENKAYLGDGSSLCAVKKVIGHIHE